VSGQPPQAPGQPQVPAHGSLRCPRCSATVGPEQDWCLECGAPARTRLAQTPNWQLPTVAIGAIVLIAGAMLAFAFVKLSSDGGAPAATVPAATVTTAAPPALAPTAPTPLPAATTPAQTTTSATTPGQTPLPPAPPATTQSSATTPPTTQTGTTSTRPTQTTIAPTRTAPRTTTTP
jgi:hypothetical protein